MVTLLKKSRIGLVALGATALMAIAGWQFGTNGTQEEFSGKEVAMENAIAGSGDGGKKCKTGSRCTYSNYLYCAAGQTGDSCVCYYCN